MPLIAKHRGTVLVGDDAARGLEGLTPGTNVVIAFPSEAEAVAFYDDAKHQRVKEIRLSATRNHAAIVSPSFEY